MSYMLVGFFVFTAFGTIVGVLSGLVLMNRKRVTPTEAHLAALQKELAAPDVGAPPSGAPGVSLEDLRKLVVDRDDALRETHEELEKAQRLSEQAKAQVEQESLRRSAAEQRTQELEAQVAALSQQISEKEAGLKGREDLEARMAALTAELTYAQSAGHEQSASRAREREELEAQVAALTAELDFVQKACQEQLESHTKEMESRNEQIAGLTGELAAVRSSSERDTSYRSSLEGQLTADREYISQLTGQLAEMQRELSTYQARLLEQRQLAAKGMEFLTQAHDNFAGVFRAFYNGNGAETPVYNGVETSIAAE